VSPIRSAPHQAGAEDPGSAAGRAARLRRWAPRAVLAAVVLLVTTGCKSTTLTRLGLPPSVTKQGDVVISLWQGSWIAAWIVGAVVWGLILWAVLFHRKRGDRIPHQVRYNLPIEFLYTVVPFIMVGVLFYFTARDENFINKVSAHPDVVVDVKGFQWSWEFDYPQYKVAGSQTRVVTELGSMWPGKLPLMEIPVGKTVQFNLSSVDVVHAFWVDAFEFKRDVLPDHPNTFEITANKTGTFTGRCSELCGLYHSRMLFTLKIVTPEQFQQWITAQQNQQLASGGVQ
jgi:cytochrome c oxidase subunit II